MFAATEEMARISIEASAALAGWIALHRRVRGGGLSFAITSSASFGGPSESPDGLHPSEGW